MIDGINTWKERTYGFTASPLREEFKEEWFEMLYWHFHETNKESLPVKVYWIKKERKYTIDYAMQCKGDLAPDSYEIYRNMLNNDGVRTQEIVDIAIGAMQKNDRVIVFTDRTAIAKSLYEKISERFSDTFLLIWETSNQNIVEKVADLEKFIIVASIGVAGEGLDIPNLNVWVLTFNTSNLKTVRQSAGRVRRYFGDKKFWIYIDIQDVIQVWTGKKYYWWASKRKKIYKELDFIYKQL